MRIASDNATTTDELALHWWLRARIADTAGTSAATSGVPLVCAPRTPPRILAPAQVDAFLAALRTHGHRAVVETMVLGRLRRCECSGFGWLTCRLRLGGCSSLRARAGINDSFRCPAGFAVSAASYLDIERPVGAVTDRVFVVLKGSRRGRALSAAGRISRRRLDAGGAGANAHVPN